MIAGISRIRNESLILQDTLTHFLKHCDHIFIYDDCSTDNSVEIMRSFDDVTVIEGKEWQQDQWQQETRHRSQVLELAREYDMCLCFDADERLDGELPQGRGGYTFNLYDGYMTKEYNKPYISGDLSRLPRLWGIEKREILMYFEPKKAEYNKHGQREPSYSGRVQESNLKVKHYGKCLSVEHWEETCDFYAQYFPQWREKWLKRKGKAIHTESDFNTPLINWNKL